MKFIFEERSRLRMGVGGEVGRYACESSVEDNVLGKQSQYLPDFGGICSPTTEVAF